MFVFNILGYLMQLLLLLLLDQRMRIRQNGPCSHSVLGDRAGYFSMMGIDFGLKFELIVTPEKKSESVSVVRRSIIIFASNKLLHVLILSFFFCGPSLAFALLWDIDDGFTLDGKRR